MANLIINGGRPLEGTIRPSGNKNAVLPILCASLLTDDPVTLHNVPSITDAEKLTDFFEQHGSKISWERKKKTLTLDHRNFCSEQQGELPVGMRSSVLLFAPLMLRWKKIKIQSSIKGCSLGVRELDPHLDILSRFGASIDRGNPLTMNFNGRFRSIHYWADYMSVTATETFLMAAVLSEETSDLNNAASEPHVQDLCHFLTRMGASITGIGTSRLNVRGVETLKGTALTISSDYHEIATFLALGAITGGEVIVEDNVPRHMELITRSFGKLGVTIEMESKRPGGDTGSSAIVRAGQSLQIQQPLTPNLLPKIEAAPWPYFPVDLLPVMVALSVKAHGAMMFWNKVYEGGFSWLPELTKFGAHVVVSDPHRIIVFGNKPLRAATVEAPYIIRAAIALFMVASSIPGHSTVKNADPIRRAHPYFVENLKKIGADVRWEDQS